MKTINFLTSHFLPENTACTNRVLAYINELEKTYKVNVICLTEKGVSLETKIVEYSENSTIYYLVQDDFDGKNFFKRAFYEMKYINKLINISKSLESDITMATSPYMFMIPFVALRVRGEKILDIRDMVWEYLGENSFVGRVVKKILGLLMSFSMKYYDKVIVTNNYEYTLAKEKYSLKDIHIVPNGISEENYKKLVSIKHEENSDFTVTYIGNLGLAQNIMTLIRAAEELSDIEFIIIGDGIEANTLKKYVDTHSLKNITFTGKLAWDELSSYYKKSSMLYAQLDQKFVSAMPSKLYEYTTIALPIVYGGVGEAKLFIDKLENAICIEPNNKDLLVQTIKEIRNKPVTISHKNRELINSKFLREKVVKDILKKLID